MLGFIGKMLGGAAVAAGESMEMAGAVAAPLAVAAETAAVAGTAATFGAEVAVGAGAIGTSAIEAGAVGVTQAESVLSLIPPVTETAAVAGETASISNLPLIDSFLALPESVAPVTETAAIAEKAPTFFQTSPLPPLEIPGVMENSVPPSPEPVIAASVVEMPISTPSPTGEALPEPDVIPKAPEPEAVKFENPSDQTINLPRENWTVKDGVAEASPLKTEEAVTAEPQAASNNPEQTKDDKTQETELKVDEPKQPEEKLAKTEAELQEEELKKLREEALKEAEEELKDFERRKKQRELEELEMQKTFVEIQIAGIRRQETKTVELSLKLGQLEDRRIELNLQIGVLKASMALSMVAG